MFSEARRLNHYGEVSYSSVHKGSSLGEKSSFYTWSKMSNRSKQSVELVGDAEILVVSVPVNGGETF